MPEHVQAEVMQFVMCFGDMVCPDLPLHAGIITPQLMDAELGAQIRQLRIKIATLDENSSGTSTGMWGMSAVMHLAHRSGCRG